MISRGCPFEDNWIVSAQQSTYTRTTLKPLLHPRAPLKPHPPPRTHLGYSEDPPGECPALGELKVYGMDRCEVGELRQDLPGGARERERGLRGAHGVQSIGDTGLKAGVGGRVDDRLLNFHTTAGLGMHNSLPPQVLASLQHEYYL